MRWFVPVLMIALFAGCLDNVPTTSVQQVLDASSNEGDVRVAAAGFEGDYVPEDDGSDFRFDLDNGVAGDGELASWFLRDWNVSDPLHPQERLIQVDVGGHVLAEERYPLFEPVTPDNGEAGPAALRSMWRVLDQVQGLDLDGRGRARPGMGSHAGSPTGTGEEGAEQLCPVRDGMAADPFELPVLESEVSSAEVAQTALSIPSVAAFWETPGMDIIYRLTAYQAWVAEWVDDVFTRWCIQPGLQWTVELTDLDLWENRTFSSLQDLPPLMAVTIDPHTGEVLDVQDYSHGWPRFVDLFPDTDWEHTQLLPTLPGDRDAIQWTFHIPENSTWMYLTGLALPPLGTSQERWEVITPDGDVLPMSTPDGALARFEQDDPAEGTWTLQYSYVFTGVNGQFQGFRAGGYIAPP